jgi:acetylornithine deacetylase/succinyl-diaminopimelate desuccinylase-like protein
MKSKLEHLFAASERSVTLLLLCGILVTVATIPTRSSAQGTNPAAEQLAQDPRVSRALTWLTDNVSWATDEQARITEIPAPPFQETQRAAYIRKLFLSYGLRVVTDDAGNVLGQKAGQSDDEVVILSAHLDTVFPANAKVTVKREGARLSAPGISDNGSGLASLVALARVLHETKIKTRRTIVFAANVGEEGEGNLRGMRKIVEAYGKRLKYVIVLDGASTDHVTTSALASRRIEVTITGPGGHSWSDFGLPNPIHAMGRGINRFIRVRVPDNPRTTFNVGVIEGGTSVNSIPFRASIKVDLRSEAETELDHLQNALRDAMEAGVAEEMAAATERGKANRGAEKLEVKLRVLGVRPGGELPANSPLLAAVLDADRYLGNHSRTERSSTDANIPLSMGISAISLGCGGKAGGAHSLAEWYEPAGRELGLKRILLTLLEVTGVQP